MIEFIRLSLAHLTVMDASPLELVDAAAAGGFNSIGLRIISTNPTFNIVPVVGDEVMIRAIEERLRYHGIDILDVEAVQLVPDTDVGKLMPALETATRLGARYLQVANYDPDEGRAADNLAQIADAAQRLEIKPMLEFVSFYPMTRTVKSALRLLRRAGHENAGLVIDTLHLIRSGGGPSDLQSMDPDVLGYCQICDGRVTAPPPDRLRVEALGDRLYPGQGDFPMREIIAALPAGVPLSVEAPCAADAHRPIAERGRRCGETTRSFLQAISTNRRH